MLTIRVGYVDTAEARAHADAIAAALRSLPATRHLEGTVLIGCGGAAGMTRAARPMVAVPLAWLAAPDALMRARISQADAVVLADAMEFGAIRAALRSDTIVLVSGPGDDGSPFLRGAGPREVAAAREVIASHPELAAALRADTPGAAIGDPGTMALACVEALLATGAPMPATSGTAEGQG